MTDGEKFRGKRLDNATCQRAIDTWGKTSQLIVSMEEMAELTKELSKNLRGRDNDLGIAEEVADVEIMLEQLKIIFDIRKEVEILKIKKLRRLERRIRELSNSAGGEAIDAGGIIPAK